MLIFGVLAFFGNKIFPYETTALQWTYGAVALLFAMQFAGLMIIERKSATLSPAKWVNLFMGLKVGKMLISLAYILTYVILVRIEIKRFLAVFLALYLLYLAFDTIYLTNRQKAMKKQEDKK